MDINKFVVLGDREFALWIRGLLIMIVKSIEKRYNIN